MPPLIWSEAALRDLHRHYRYLLARNPGAARRAIKAIRAGVQVLSRQPGIARPAAEMPAEYREGPIDFGDTGCLALYRYDGREAVILAVRQPREAGY